MSKDKTDELTKVYDEILGKGAALPTSDNDDVRKPVNAASDEAYANEDYSDDAGDGGDPREDEKEVEPDAEEDEIPADETGGDDDDDGEIIDPRLVSAGRRARLDDDTIIELAEQRPEILEALANNQEEAAQALANRANPQESAERKQEDKENVADDSDPLREVEALLANTEGEDYDDLSPTAKKIIRALTAKVKTLDDAVKGQSQGLGEIQAKAQRESSRRIDEFFDGHSKTITVLGSTGSGKPLTQEQKDARLYAFRVARGVQQVSDGMSDEEALAIGVNALKGSLSETQLKAKLVSDLNANRKRFTARYKGRSRSEAPRSAELRAREAIDKVLDDPKYQRRL